MGLSETEYVAQHPAPKQEKISKPGLIRSKKSNLSDYGLNRLFDPDNADHLSVGDQLKLYKKRDLEDSKFYKCAVKVFWAPRSRKRVLVAQPKDALRGGHPDAPKEEKSRFSKPSLPEDKVGEDTTSIEELEKIIDELEKGPEKPISRPPPEKPSQFTEPDERVEYRTWLEKRKALRSDIDSMGLSEDWLTRKPNKTELEMRVLRKIIDDRTPKIPVPKPIPEPPLEFGMSEDIPRFRRPCPDAISLLEHFLAKKKMRLVDLFTLVDKDKSWSLTKDDFVEAIKLAGMNMSNDMLEDLMVSLDVSMTKEITYKDLLRGMKSWKKEKLDTKRKQLALGTGISNKVLSAPQPRHPAVRPLERHLTAPDSLTDALESQNLRLCEPRKEVTFTSDKSPQSNERLTPPPSDLRPEVYDLGNPEAMVDLRKMNRELLKRGKKKRSQRKTESFQNGKSMIRTGTKAIDSHCRPSTLTGEIGDMVDNFRQLRLKEYDAIVKLCKEYGVVLSEKLLERVLFHPPDKSHKALKKKLRQPGGEMMSSHFADPPKQPTTPIEEKHQGHVIKTSSGKLLIDSRRMYPQTHTVKSHATKMTLSTGRAVVHRKVDCWMTFEEYDRLTRNLAARYTELGKSDSNAFWPGHLLDKLRLCMPPYDSHQHPGVSSVFQPVVKEKKVYPGYNNDLNTFPVGENGHSQFVCVDPYLRKY